MMYLAPFGFDRYKKIEQGDIVAARCRALERLEGLEFNFIEEISKEIVEEIVGDVIGGFDEEVVEGVLDDVDEEVVEEVLEEIVG